MATYLEAGNTICHATILMQKNNDTRFQIGLSFAATGEGADMDALRDALATIVETQFKACLSNQINIRQIKVDQPATGAQTLKDYLTLTGTNANDPAPLSVALVVSVRTGSKYRYRNGRFYISGMSRLDVKGDVMDPGNLAPYNAFLTALVNAFMVDTPASGWHLGVYTPGGTFGGVTVPAQLTGATTLRLNQIVGNQRRRRLGVGS